MMYGCEATGRQSCAIFGFWPIFPIQNRCNVPSGDQPTAQGLHRRMILIFPCDSRRSKWVPSGTEDFLRLLVALQGPPNLPKFRLWQMAISIQNATAQRVRSGPKISENAQF